MQKILAIDDNQDNLGYLKMLLNKLSPEAVVFTARSGPEGLEIARKELPDVILLDIVMPGMDGYEVCTQLKAEETTCHIPLIMITAFRIDSESRVKAINSGADVFLPRPIDQTELLAQINAMLRIKRAEDQLREEKARLKQLVQQRTEHLQQELDERKRTEEAVRLNESRIEALLKLSQMTGVSLHQIADFVLEEAVKLTRSKVGFIGFLDKDETVMHLHAWSKDAMDQCAIEDKPLHFPIDKAGIWGEAIRQRKIMIINDYSAPHPHKKGYPEGHVHLARLISVPVFEGEQIVAITVVGNKREEYDESDARQVKLLTDGMWKFVQRKRAEEEIQKSHRRESVLNTLLRISMEDISLEKQLERVLDEILAIPWLPVMRQGGIFLVGDDPKVLKLQVQRGFDLPLQTACASIPFGKCLCGQAASRGEIQFADRVDERHEIHYKGMHPHGHYCVPIMSGDKVVGTIVLYLNPEHRQDVQEEEFLKAVAYTLAGIIERKRAEEALKENESKLKEAQRIAQLGYWELDLVKNKLYWSDEIYRIFGLKPQKLEATYETFLQTVHPEDRDFVNKAYTDSIKNKTEYDIVHRLLLKNGEVKYVNERCKTEYNEHGNPLRSIGTVLDITERELAEEALRKSREQLRELTARLAEVEEAERQRLARELHDRVGQNLTALSINLNILCSQLPSELAVKMGDRLNDAQNLLEETTEAIRNVMADLRPAVLDDYGLLAALRWYGNLFSRRTGIPVAVQGEDFTPGLSTTIETALFRIAQEALTNIAKHAEAKQVTISPDVISGKSILTIVDDGIGFDPATLQSSGWGLIAMRERALAVGGHLEVESSPGNGTKIVVEIERNR